MDVVDAAASNSPLVRQPFPPSRAGTDFTAFSLAVAALQEVFAASDPLALVPCDPDYKEQVVRDARTFLGAKGIEERHLLWMRRLAPIARLPRGLPIVDWGGGYGLDALVIAACGHEVILRETRLSALAVFGFLAERLAQVTGPLATHSVLADQVAQPPLGPVQAILLHAAARETVDDEALLVNCLAALPVNGQLFLSDRNVAIPRPKRLRARTWRRLAEKAGFLFVREHYHCAARSKWREILEVMPGLRRIAASHVTLHFAK